MAEPQATPSPEDVDEEWGGEFVMDGGTVDICLAEDGVTWTTEKSKEPVSLEWHDVIGCHRGYVSFRKPEHFQEAEDQDALFSVHYVDRHRGNVWKHRWKTFTSNTEHVDRIMELIEEKARQDGPERLVVIINPAAGPGRGKTHYNDDVAPLFKLAKIQTDVIVSKDKHHVEEIGKEYDFSTVDGVVIVGGDGTFQQLIHTWLPRIQKAEKINIHSHDLKHIPCPVGMIPTGTENGLASTMYGCLDTTTAALHIITGRKTWRHLLGVTSSGTHLGFSGILLVNGSWCDMMDGQMERRWLGPLRAPIGAVGVFFRKRREFDIRLEYLPYISRDSHTDEVSAPQLEWECAMGRYTGVHCFPGVFTRDKTGSVHADVNAQGMTLILEKQCSRFKYCSWLYKMRRLDEDMFDADFVRVKPVKAYKLKIVPKKEEIPEEDLEGKLKREKEVVKEHRCRIDGEVRQLKYPEVEVRIVPKVLEMYGTGCFSFT